MNHKPQAREQPQAHEPAHAYDATHASHGTSFDERARTWDDPAKLHRAEVVSAAILHAARERGLPDQPRALDVGCGTGLVTWPIADAFAHVTLADGSTGMLDVVRERLAERPDSERFTTLQLELGRQAPPGRSFDLVYCVMALHHVVELDAALAALAGSLRTGGTLAVVDLDHAPDFHGAGFTGHHGFRRAELADALRRAGLSEVAVSTVFETTGAPHNDGGGHGGGTADGGGHGGGATDGGCGEHSSGGQQVPTGEDRAFTLFLAVATKP